MTATGSNHESPFRLSYDATVEGLAPGTYQVDARVMAVDNVVYVPNLSASHVVIEADKESGLTVDYRPRQNMVSDHQDFTHKMTKGEGQTLRVPLNVPRDFRDGAPTVTIEALGLPSTLTPQVELQNLETGTILRFAIDAIPYTIPSGRYRLFVPYIAHENMYFGVDSPFSALTISKDAPLSLVLEYTIQ